MIDDRARAGLGELVSSLFIENGLAPVGVLIARAPGEFKVDFHRFTSRPFRANDFLKTGRARMIKIAFRRVPCEMKASRPLITLDPNVILRMLKGTASHARICSIGRP